VRGLPLGWAKLIPEPDGKSSRPQGKAIDSFETTFVSKIIFDVKSEQRLQEYERDFSQAPDCVEDVSAVSKTVGMDQGEFADGQAILDHLLLQRGGIDFNAAFESLEQLLRIEKGQTTFGFRQVSDVFS
jgi:hypothetical protein